MRIFRFVLLMLCAFALVACGTAQDRAAKYLARAKTSYEAEDYVKAEIDLKNTLQIDPNNVEAHYLFAQVSEKEQNWPNMFGHLRAVVDLDPTHKDARLKLLEDFQTKWVNDWLPNFVLCALPARNMLQGDIGGYDKSAGTWYGYSSWTKPARWFYVDK